MTITAAYVLLLGALLVVDPLERYRSWRRRGEQIVGIAEWEAKRDALRRAVEK